MPRFMKVSAAPRRVMHINLDRIAYVDVLPDEGARITFDNSFTLDLMPGEASQLYMALKSAGAEPNQATQD